MLKILFGTILIMVGSLYFWIFIDVKDVLALLVSLLSLLAGLKLLRPSFNDLNKNNETVAKGECKKVH